jgi:hypothetical protein
MEAKIFVDNLCFYDPEFKSFAENFRKESNKTGGTSTIHEIKTMDDLRDAFNKYSQAKFLEVSLHGSPGMIHFANGGAMVGSYLNNLCVNPSFLQKNARILFDSCSIGEGSQGDSFMDSIGAGILKGKGGTVGATTVTNWAYLHFGAAYMEPLSFGRLKVKRYDESGTQISSQTVDRHGIKR